MYRRSFLISGLAFAGCARSPSGPMLLAPNSTLIVVRHADREGETLTTRGIKRAQDLVTALQGVSLDGIYAPGIHRNLATAAPLETARGLSVQRIPAEAPTEPLIRYAKGKTVIWIGNKGNIRRIWEDLSLTEPAPLNYGDLHIIRSNADGVLSIERLVF